MSIFLRLYNNIFVRLYNELFRVTDDMGMTTDEVIELLNSLLDGTLSHGEWDYFMTEELRDPELEGNKRPGIR